MSKKSRKLRTVLDTLFERKHLDSNGTMGLIADLVYEGDLKLAACAVTTSGVRTFHDEGAKGA